MTKHRLEQRIQAIDAYVIKLASYLPKGPLQLKLRHISVLLKQLIEDLKPEPKEYEYEISSIPNDFALDGNDTSND